MQKFLSELCPSQSVILSTQRWCLKGIYDDFYKMVYSEVYTIHEYVLILKTGAKVCKKVIAGAQL